MMKCQPGQYGALTWVPLQAQDPAEHLSTALWGKPNFVTSRLGCEHSSCNLTPSTRKGQSRASSFKQAMGKHQLGHNVCLYMYKYICFYRYTYREIFNKVSLNFIFRPAESHRWGGLRFGGDPAVQIFSIWNANESSSIKMSSLPLCLCQVPETAAKEHLA